jgi:pseudaminic acid cytidylyltransferase
MNIAIIPARGGSKRIPRKNIKLFNGKPMIAWSIETARDSGLFSHIIVTTEDDEIANVANNYGAITPFRRPHNLSDDFTPTVPVISHAVTECLKLGWKIEYACCIYPCAPFIDINDLHLALDLIKKTNSKFIYPVVEYSHPIHRAMHRSNTGKMKFVFEDCELSRTQDLQKSYHDAGQFYWGEINSWIANFKMHTDGITLVIPSWRTVDIDSEDDWKRAEILYKFIHGQNKKNKS